MPRVLRLFPTMVFPALVYGVIVLLAGPKSVSWLGAEAFAVPMASGDIWRVTFGSLFLSGALVCFFVELLRTSSPSASAIGINLILACAFAPCVGLFLLAPGFATNEFFLVCLMMLLDFLLDSAVLVFTSRRTIELSGSH